MIQCIDFSKSYSKKCVINNSNLEIEGNKISFLMGANGSGKTTLIKCLMGMENYEGKINFDSKNINQVREKCLVIWDDCPFYNNLSGITNLMIFGETQKSKKQIIEIATKRLEYDLLRKNVKTYSYGQKKKLALSLVEILQPKYLFMDEISNGLDYDMMKELKKDIMRWSETTTIFLTGHQFGFYNELVDSLFAFKDKQIVLLEENFSKCGETLEEIYDKKMH